MARKTDPALQERNQKLIAYVRANPFKSDAEIAELHGMKPQRARQIMSEAGLINSVNRRKTQRRSEMKSRSNLHVMVGMRIQDKFSLELERAIVPGTVAPTGEKVLRDIALTLRFTVQTLRRVMTGMENITISDLQRIAEWLETTPGKLLLLCEQQAVQYSVRKRETTGSSPAYIT